MYRIQRKDCAEFMWTIEDGSVDLILTDPPYNLGLFMQNRDAGIMRMRDNYFYVCDNCLEKAYDLLVRVKVVGE